MKLHLISIAFISLFIASCQGGYNATKGIDGDTITTEASLLTLIDCGDWTAAEIRAPWSDSIPIGKYAIMRPGVDNALIPDGYTVIHAPLKNSIVFSSVYTAVIDELGMIESVKGVADGGYFLPEDTVSQLIDQDKIVDVGSSMSPLIEKAIDIEPDAILLSPYSGGSRTGLERLGVPMVWMADYLETSPLGRAEWIMLIGELYGERDEAIKIYNKTKRNYANISSKTLSAKSKPTVITEKPMSGVWYVPGGKSYIAKMIADAGGNYPWADTTDSGSITLDEAAVINRGADADIWVIKDTNHITEQSLLRELPRAKVMKPFPNGVFYCNTLAKPYYNIIAFHPDRILADMAAVFHPELFPEQNLEFYQRLK